MSQSQQQLGTMGCQWINMPCSSNSKKVIIFLIKIVFSLFGAQTLRSPLSRLIKSAWNFSLDLRCSLCGMTSGVKRILRLFNFTRCIDAKMNDLCLDNWAVVISRVNHLWLNGLSDFCYYFHKLFPLRSMENYPISGSHLAASVCAGGGKTGTFKQLFRFLISRFGKSSPSRCNWDGGDRKKFNSRRNFLAGVFSKVFYFWNFWHGSEGIGRA